MAIAPLAAASAQNSTVGKPTSLSALSSNFGNFLSLLMTQLKNQDPTAPLDTNQFTSQLVQFSSVEQQIATNTSLGKLIEMTQATGVMQSSTMIGKQVTVTSDHIPLQNGAGRVGFDAPHAGPASIAIYSDAGVKIRDASLTAAAGPNRWSWDGLDNAGKQVADGAYRIAVTGADTKGTATALPFTVSGVATSVTNKNNAVSLQLGAMSVKFGAVQSVGAEP